MSTKNIKEIWKPIKEVDGYYEVSNKGKVRRAKPGRNTYVGRHLKLHVNKQGYIFVKMTWKEWHTQKFVHILVAGTFIGPKPKGTQVNHKDLNKQNNCDWNLEYMTPKENTAHAIRNGHFVFTKSGEDAISAKLTDVDVIHMRKLHSTGRYTLKDLSNKFNIGISRTCHIVNYKAWVHVR